MITEESLRRLAMDSYKRGSLDSLETLRESFSMLPSLGQTSLTIDEVLFLLDRSIAMVDEVTDQVADRVRRS